MNVSVTFGACLFAPLASVDHRRRRRRAPAFPDGLFSFTREDLERRIRASRMTNRLKCCRHELATSAHNTAHRPTLPETVFMHRNEAAAVLRLNWIEPDEPPNRTWKRCQSPKARANVLSKHQHAELARPRARNEDSRQRRYGAAKFARQRARLPAMK